MQVGEKVADFTLAATDGTEFSLSKALSENNSVVLLTFTLCFTGG